MDDMNQDLKNTSRRQLLKSALIGGAVIGAPSISNAQSLLAEKGGDVSPPIAAYVFRLFVKFTVISYWLTAKSNFPQWNKILAR